MVTLLGRGQLGRQPLIGQRLGRLRVPGCRGDCLRRFGLEAGQLGVVTFLGRSKLVGQRPIGIGGPAFALRVMVGVGIGRKYRLRPARGRCLCRRWRRGPSIAIEPGDDASHVTVEVGIGPNGDTVAVDKGSNRLRDVFFRRHRRTANEERHDRNLPGQRGLDLDPHKVSGIFEPRGAALRIQPTGPDDGQKDIALAHHPTEIFAEIDTQEDRIQILQNLLATISPSRADRKSGP